MTSVIQVRITLQFPDDLGDEQNEDSEYVAQQQFLARLPRLPMMLSRKFAIQDARIVSGLVDKDGVNLD